MRINRLIDQGPKIEFMGSVTALVDRLLGDTPKAAYDTDWRVKKLQAFIDSHDGQIGWDLDQICRELGLGISASYAGRLFKRCIGFGVREYAKRKRLRIAIQQLRTTTLSVKEIAANLGYRSSRVFERRFKVLLHLSPTEFRKIPR